MLPLFSAVGTSSHFQMTVQRYNKFLIYANNRGEKVKKW